MGGDLGSAARYQHVRSLLTRDVPPGAEVVEFGAAPGDQIAALADSGYRATALDIGIASDQWASRADGSMLRLFRVAGVRFIQWDLERAPYPLADESFDAVVMTEVFEHLRDYPVNALREARRVLRPGGRLYFTTPNAAYLANRWRLLRGRSVATPLDDWVGGLPHARHAREYTFAEVRRLMAIVELDVVRAESRHFHLGNRAGRVKGGTKRAVALAARLRPTLGPSIVIVAERSQR